LTEHELVAICAQRGVSRRWATRPDTKHYYLYLTRRDGTRTRDVYICSSRRFPDLTRTELERKLNRLPGVRQEAAEPQRLDTSIPAIADFLRECGTFPND
jgi:hypothetical protein